MKQFTTHQVARMVGVSLQSVVNWIDDGRIEGTRTSGGHRRVSRAALLTFLRRQRLAIPQTVLLADRTHPRILLVEGQAEFGDVLKEFLIIRGQYDVDLCSSVFEAGWLAGTTDPDVLLLDIDLPGSQQLTDGLARFGQRRLPVVAFTAVPRRQRRNVMLKPLSFDDVYRRIDEHLTGE